MKISPIRTYSVNSYKNTTFTGAKANDSLNNTINTTPSADTTQFKMSASNIKSKKTLISRLNNILKPAPSVEKFDPRNSQSPWVRSFLF